MKGKLQLYYDIDVESKVHELVQAFEELGHGKRGYTNNKLLEALKVYQILAERCGTVEPMDVMLHYLDLQVGILPTQTKKVVDEQNEIEQDTSKEFETVSNEVDSSVADLVSDGDFDFED